MSKVLLDSVSASFKPPKQLAAVEKQLNHDYGSIEPIEVNTENQPSTFRYWFSEPDAVLRVNFESEQQPRVFPRRSTGCGAVESPTNIGIQPNRSVNSYDRLAK